MASASTASASRLCALTRRQTPRLREIQAVHQRFANPFVGYRPFASSPLRQAPKTPSQKKDGASDTPKPAAQKAASSTDAAAAGAGAATKSTSSLPALGSLEAAAEMGAAQDLDEIIKMRGYADLPSFLKGVFPNDPRADRLFEQELKAVEANRKNPRSFWFDEEDPDMDTDEVEEFNEDDMTEMAHAKLEEIKEMRHYQRLAVWELPLLSKLAKPFVPPSENEVLRWRYTTYFGDAHPAEKKVVVQFAPDDLKLTPVQTNKLKKLAGTRYDPETEVVKISCESYEHQAQNKRYLYSVVEKLIAEAKDPKDTFEDIPLDTRHKVVKAKPRFPKEWLMTEERKKLLEDQRVALQLEEGKKSDEGKIVDGQRVIEGYLLAKMREEQENQAKLAAETVALPARSNARAGASRAKR